MKTPPLVRIYPSPTHFIPGVPHVVQDVTPERAAELLAYTPAAFTIDPSVARAEPVPVQEAGPPEPED